MSREKILAKIAQNQSAKLPLPNLSGIGNEVFEVLPKFKNVLESIGGKVVEVADYQGVMNYIQTNFESKSRIISTLPELQTIAELDWQTADPHELENVELVVIKGHFGVAENGAIWVTESLLGQRVAPFIAQYLAIILQKKDFVPTMQQAYDRIGNAEYDFGTFIAGPSKTADIEQSLVLGAARSEGIDGLFVALIIKPKAVGFVPFERYFQKNFSQKSSKPTAKIYF